MKIIRDFPFVFDSHHSPFLLCNCFSNRRIAPICGFSGVRRSMSGGEKHSSGYEMESYDLTMDALSSLITKRSRAEKSNSGDRFDLLFDYLKILELDEAIKTMKVIHVAGTKGKGSTCTFTESILRNCGFRTGLFTSPHLIDIRERFCLDGSAICKKKFMKYFWWSYNKLKDNVTENFPIPTYFRFLALLAFKIFAEEQVDVVILEVGLGGTFDATNVIPAPVVCGVSSLGYDHMEILGDTLQQIAAEKAGIFKRGVPAFTVEQPEEAMLSLEEKASKLNVDLRIASPVDGKLLDGQKLGLDGEHQLVNAGLAVALSVTWLRCTGRSDIFNLCDTQESLPDEFVRGLTGAKMQGRAQIVADDSETNGRVMFYLDGAHSPESMDICGRWFSLAVKRDNYYREMESKRVRSSERRTFLGVSELCVLQILLFNCMDVRDPQVLLPRLVRACLAEGVQFHRAVFVPSSSVYYKVGEPSGEGESDLSWQKRMQRVWESTTGGYESSVVMPSIPVAIRWIREMAQRNSAVQLQVLVTGSLHLIGDVLRFVKK